MQNSQIGSVSVNTAFTPVFDHAGVQDNSGTAPSDFFAPDAGSQILNFDMQKAAKFLSEKGKLNKIENPWTFNIVGTVNDPPAKGPDGALVFGCNGGPGGGTLYSVDPVLGTKNWEYPSGIILNAPVVSADNTVYGCTSDSRIFAVKGDTGEEIWQKKTESRHNSTPLVCDNGLVYIGTGDGSLLALRQSDGEKEWSIDGKKMVGSPPAEGPDNTLIFGGHDHILCRVNKDTGEPVWEKNLEWNISSTPVISDDQKTIYASTSRGTIMALNMEDGEILWSQKTGNNFETDAQIIKGKPGELFVKSNDDRIYKIREGDGQNPRVYPGSARIYHQPFLFPDGKSLCYGNSNGEILCKDTDTGTTKWSHKLNGEIFSVSRDPDTGLIYATGKNGVTALKLLTAQDQIDQLKEEITKPGETAPAEGIEFSQGDGFVSIGGVKLEVDS